MKVKDLIKQLSKLNPNLDLLFSESKPSNKLMIDVDLIQGFAVSWPKDQDVFGTRSPFFVASKEAYRMCEDGQTYLDFTSPDINPAIFLASREVDFLKACEDYKSRKRNELGCNK